jgi:hypothetical protein
MGFFKRLIDFFTLGSDRPGRRLLAYYIVLGLVTAVVLYSFPPADRLFSGELPDAVTAAPQLLQDGLSEGQFQAPSVELPPRVELALTTVLIMIATLALMLPVTWLYMSARKTRGHNQAIVQTLIILPIVVAGIVLVVRNSLALAFSLAGVVAAVRFRTTLRDARDVVFVFLAIAVGFAAGVQSLTVAAVVSIVFNFVVLLTWRYDFGRNVLEPTASSLWAEPLNAMTQKRGDGAVPDRDLVLALTQKKAGTLAKRLNRVRKLLGPKGKKPRFNAILTITTDAIGESQARVGAVLDQVARRWKLDEIVTNDGKPSELYYLLRVRKSTTRDDLLTAIRTSAGDKVVAADLEIGGAVEKEAVEKKEEAKEVAKETAETG